MKRRWILFTLTALVGAGMVVFAARISVAENVKTPPAAPPRVAEPAKGVAVPKLPPSLSKEAIEVPTELLVKGAGAPADGFVNPKVEPGKIRWYASFAAARAASSKSGKPVLLFQMMGKLDDKFC